MYEKGNCSSDHCIIILYICYITTHETIKCYTYTQPFQSYRYHQTCCGADPLPPWAGDECFISEMRAISLSRYRARQSKGRVISLSFNTYIGRVKVEQIPYTYRVKFYEEKNYYDIASYGSRYEIGIVRSYTYRGKVEQVLSMCYQENLLRYCLIRQSLRYRYRPLIHVSR